MCRMIDLGVITGSLSPSAGGLFESVRLPVNQLHVEGFDCSVYGLDDDMFDTAARSAWKVKNLGVFPCRGPVRLGYSPQMRAAVIEKSHEVLHLHGIWSYQSSIVNQWRTRHAGATVISPRGMLDPWALKRSRYRKSLASLMYERRNLADATVLHALNTVEATAFREFGLRGKIAIIPNGVDIAIADQARFSPPPWQERDERKYMLYLARLHPKKGVSDLLRAWRALLNMAPRLAADWKLVLAGWDDGGHLRQFQTITEQLGLTRHVTFAGGLFGEEKLAALQHASAFVLPSYSEGLPMSVLEAWIHALPVFMTDECNISDAFAFGAGFRITHDPTNMARTFASVLDQETDLATTGVKGRQLCERCFSWDKVVEEQATLYRWIVSGGPDPDFILQ